MASSITNDNNNNKNTKNLKVKKRPRCATCTNPLNSCLCESLPSSKIIMKYNVIILQHPKEAKKKSLNTVLLLKLCIENCYVYVDTDFSPGRYPLLDKALAQEDNTTNSNNQQNLVNSFILYPGTNSKSIREISNIIIRIKNNNNGSNKEIANNRIKNINPNDGIANKPTLIAIDGTWNQAKFIMHSNPRILEKCNEHLNQLLRIDGITKQPTSNLILQVMLVDDVDDDEYLRTEPRKHYMATAIAVARALEIIENKNGKICLNNVTKMFDHMQSITRKYQGKPKKNFTFQSYKDFENESTMKEIKILFENAINKYITSSDKAKFENKDILHHPIIIAYPLHKKDSSIVFKRLKCIDQFISTVPQGKAILTEVNTNLKRVRGQRLTLYTKNAWEKYLNNIPC